MDGNIPACLRVSPKQHDQPRIELEQRVKHSKLAVIHTSPSIPVHVPLLMASDAIQ